MWRGSVADYSSTIKGLVKAGVYFVDSAHKNIPDLPEASIGLVEVSSMGSPADYMSVKFHAATNNTHKMFWNGSTWTGWERQASAVDLKSYPKYTSTTDLFNIEFFDANNSKRILRIYFSGSKKIELLDSNWNSIWSI